jgi:putative endonuclease
MPATTHVSDPTWWLYLLACADGRTYAGITLDVEARFAMHAEGKGAKFTRSNPPVKVLGVESFATKSEALKAEIALKKLARPERLKWATARRFRKRKQRAVRAS